MKTDAYKIGLACLVAFAMSFFIFAVPQGPYRAQLTSSLQLYVATTGLSTNDCSETAPCDSILTALRFVQSNYDLACNQVLINVADGTYPTGSNSFSGPFVGACQGPRSVMVIGDVNNPFAVVIKPAANPTSGNCWDLENGASYYIQSMKCDETAGAGADELNVYNGSTVELNQIIFGDNGTAASAYNDMTVAVRSTVLIDGCAGSIPTNYSGCGIVLDKPLGRTQQAFALVDQSYVVFNNNNCQNTSFCTPLTMISQPKYQYFVIDIDGGVFNYGAVSYPQANYVVATQCNVRLNGIVFTAGLGEGSQPNLALPGTLNTCTPQSGGQFE